MQRQATKHGHDKLQHLEDQIKILKKAEAEAADCLSQESKHSEKALALLTKANERLHNDLSHNMTQWALQLEKTRSQLADSKSNIKALWKESSILQKSVLCAKDIKDRAIATVETKIREERSVHHLKNKGIFTEEP